MSDHIQTRLQLAVTLHQAGRLDDALAIYREQFKPSAQLDRPYAMVGVPVIAAETDAEARHLFTSPQQSFTNLHRGQPGPLPPPIDALPAIVRQVAGGLTVLMDSGVRSGSDVVRAVALGAAAVLVGKGLMWSLGALGTRGPLHAMDLLIDETRSSLGQIGARTLAQARTAEIRHAGEHIFSR